MPTTPKPKRTTSRSCWKSRERAAAALFGSLRQRCSGSSGRPDCSRSDSTHDRLFLETKLRASHGVVTLLDETRELARKENKTPVVVLATKNKPGLVLVLRAEDLRAIAAEYRAGGLDPDPASIFIDANKNVAQGHRADGGDPGPTDRG